MSTTYFTAVSHSASKAIALEATALYLYTGDDTQMEEMMGIRAMFAHFVLAPLGYDDVPVDIHVFPADENGDVYCSMKPIV